MQGRTGKIKQNPTSLPEENNVHTLAFHVNKWSAWATAKVLDIRHG